MSKNVSKLLVLFLDQPLIGLLKLRLITGACYDFYFFSQSTLKTTREESKMSNFHTTLFQNSFVLVS